MASNQAVYRLSFSILAILIF